MQVYGDGMSVGLKLILEERKGDTSFKKTKY